MKNAYMPAMPLTNSNGSPVHYSSAGMENEGVMFGLTKREMMAMHICASISGSIDSEECYQRLKTVSNNCGLRVSEWISREATKQADALLAELELTAK